MYIDMDDIFYNENMRVLESDINEVFNNYALEHSSYALISHDEFVKVEDKNQNIINGVIKTPDKRTHRFIDVINALFQYYLRVYKGDIKPYLFLRDITEIILNHAHIKNFKYHKLIEANETKHPAVIFTLFKRGYYMEATNSDITDNIKMISVYAMNQEDLDEYDNDKFVPIMINKPVKSTGNIYIVLLYQMMLYAHYFFSFVKGTSAWNNI